MDKKTRAEKKKEPIKTANPGSVLLSGFPLWVGGELLFHGLPQYHRRGGA